MQINGTFYKTLYTNKEGMGVFLVNASDGKSYYQCRGEDPACYPGTPLIITGEQREGILYADEVKIDGSKNQIVIDYLSGGLFEGIGPVLAERIIDALNGEDLFLYVKKHHNLPLVKGFTQTKADMVVKTILGTGKLKDFIVLSAGYGLSYAASTAIYYRFGEESEKLLKTQPYRLLREKLIDFTRADRLAKENGLLEYSDDRIEALIFQALYISTVSGSTYILLREICKLIDNVCKEGAYTAHIPPILVVTKLNSLAASHRLVMEPSEEGTRIYMLSLYEAEKTAANEVCRLTTAAGEMEPPLDVDMIYEIEDELGVSYDDMQRQAFGILYSPGVKILTGGPGTGKTTVIKGLISYIARMGKKCVLCAPTGRAAQRMSEVCERESSTIHKLLDIRPYGKNEYRCRGKENQIREEYIIVDEVSMVGVELFAQLLNAARNGSSVILVGDTDQLPSVTPGNVLRDLITAGIETYRLDTVFRQKELSTISLNGAKINKGQIDLQTNGEFKIFRFQEGELAQMAKRAAEELQADFRPSEMFHVQLLGPVKKGDSGVFALNNVSQKLLNPSELEGIQKNDRIIFLENNYEEEYFNGDIATVISVSSEEIKVRMFDEIRTLPRSCMKDIALAYAVTIHKSQGSEYDDIIIVLPKCGMLARNLLYTAVTRAKKQVTILSEEDALERCIRTDRTGKRHSALAERIEKALQNKRFYNTNHSSCA